MSSRIRIVTQFPHEVRELEHVQIRMSDGIALAARIWLPEGAADSPVPAILEYIPYRKRDGTRRRDNRNHRYFAGHGYAAVRVDIRGSGDSEGVLTDEYLQRELDDGVELLRWIGSQPWCTGSVGMFGISWGGFNALQIAALQPPELKAIVSVCSTDDRYADDVHYMGGCLLGDNLSWASTMFSFNSLPPDPELVGERWRDMWFERLDGSGLWLKTWLEHQHRDGYWQHGSICEAWDAITCPVFAVSGWADGYSNAVFRLMEHLHGPRKGLIGPWSHKYPHLGQPGPAIGFLQECVAWWDRWLKGVDNGVMDEPLIRVWMQESVPPFTGYQSRPGRWVAESAWPSPRLRPMRLALGRWHMAEPGEVQEGGDLTIESPLSVGLFAGKWCSYAATPDLPHDQREEDGGALVFESDPLSETLEVMGAPVVELDLSSSQPIAMAAVRLSDVAPNDKATRVTYGLLNLTHRDSHEQPELLVPGRAYRVAIQLNDVAQVFPAGHRLRLSISTSYWPLAWPPPRSTRLSIRMKTSALIIPIRPPQEDKDRALRVFDSPECAPLLRTTRLTREQHNWWVTRDLENDLSTLEVLDDAGAFLIDELGLEVERKAQEWYSYQSDYFDSLRGETRWERRLRRDKWSIRTVTRTVLSCNETCFILRAELDAYEGDERVYSRNWRYEIPRDHL